MSELESSTWFQKVPCRVPVVLVAETPVSVKVELEVIVTVPRSEEHTSELKSQSTISYAVFCLKKKKKHTT